MPISSKFLLSQRRCHIQFTHTYKMRSFSWQTSETTHGKSYYIALSFQCVFLLSKCKYSQRTKFFQDHFRASTMTIRLFIFNRQTWASIFKFVYCLSRFDGQLPGTVGLKWVVIFNAPSYALSSCCLILDKLQENFR